MNTYYYKYQKYKKKYHNLLNRKYNFYFNHGTTDMSNLLSILKDGYIYPGKMVPVERHKLGGESNLDYVYMSIYFEDIKNLTHLWPYSLVLHPKIMLKYGAVFNKGWTVGPTKESIVVKKSDTMMDEKIKLMKDFLVNPIDLPEKLRKLLAEKTLHEVLFDVPIPLKDNLLAIVCTECNEKQLDKVKRAMKGKPYSGVKIITQNHPIPDLSELIKKN